MASVSRRIRRTIVHETQRHGTKRFKTKFAAWKQLRWVQRGHEGLFK